MSRKTLKERLARFMDPNAFAERVGKERREAMKARREIALKRADSAIRFFKKSENFGALSERIVEREKCNS